jgi:hypothetical protein
MKMVPAVSPSVAPGYNIGIAESNSWIPLSGAPRNIYARAVYVVNAPNQAGFVITKDTNPVYGDFNQLKMLSATSFTALTAENSTVVLAGVTFPTGFVLEGPIKGYQLASATGGVVAYKAML